MEDNNKDQKPALEIQGSRLFSNWLASAKASLAFTTYQGGKVFFIGTQADGKFSISERSFDRCMGIAAKAGRIWMSARTQLWRFENFLEAGSMVDGHDANFVPVTGHTTGDVDIHDVQIRTDGSPVFVVTRFNAIATLAERGSFRVLWTPPFIDKLAAEDRCHLNGLALEGDSLKYVTCVGPSNVSDGWRDHRLDGGLVMDVPSGETVCKGLSMPHSPRLYRDKLWIIQSGTGEFGWVDVETGRFEPVCFLPGFGRGLSFIGNHAVIGVSLPRENRSFKDLAFNARLDSEGGKAKCGLCIVNIDTGDIEHQLILDGVVQELYDVAVLPGLIRPRAIGFKTDEISHSILPEIETSGDKATH